MTTLTSKEAQSKFGQLIEAAQKEPVVVTRHERPVVVVLSNARFEQLEALEDAVWAARAREAAKGGFISSDESMAFLQGILNAETQPE